VLPSLVQHIEEYNKVPERLSFALAALIHFYHGTELEAGKLKAEREGKKYLIRDDKDALEYFADLWSRYEAEEIGMPELAENVLANQDFWDRNLNQQKGLRNSLISNLKIIEKEGMKQGLKKLIK
jgi:tagaturonate reductase